MVTCTGSCKLQCPLMTSPVVTSGHCSLQLAATCDSLRDALRWLEIYYAYTKITRQACSYRQNRRKKAERSMVKTATSQNGDEPKQHLQSYIIDRRLYTREFKSREVAQAPIYVIVYSLLELSFCTQPFPTPSGWLCRCVLTLVMALWRSINFVLLLLFLTLGRYDPEGV